MNAELPPTGAGYLGPLKPGMEVCDVDGARIGTVARLHEAAIGGAAGAGEATREDVVEVRAGFLGLRHLYIPISGVQDVQITLRDDFTMTISPSTVRAGRARFIITNEGRLSHGLGDGISVEQFIPPGGTLTRDNVMLPAGRTLMMYCPVADHASRGMRAQLVVQ